MLVELLGGGKADTVVVRLPSYSSAPAASPELVRGSLTVEPALEGALRLRGWVVPVVVVDVLPESVVDCRTGASLRYLVDVAEFARDLVARGRVLPSVDSEAPVARWVPALSGVDSVRFASLREAMPPVCRGAEGVGSPEAALRGVLHVLLDNEVRGALRGVGSLTRGRTPVDLWLRALVGEPVFEADAVDLVELRAKLGAWRASAERENAVRVCFRLSSPDQGGFANEGWRLEFLLQAVDEPSVVVLAEQVWRDDGVLWRWVDHPQEVLLADLGRASRLYPELDVALRERHPTRLDLDAAGAYEFLTRAALLAQAGFGVLLPTWWREPRRLGLRLTTTTAKRGDPGVVESESKLGLKALVGYRWDLALGEELLTEEELAELAAAKMPLVKVRGQWVHVDQQRLTAGLAFLKRGGTGRMPAEQVLLQSWSEEADDGLPLPVTGVHGDGWLGDLLSGEAEQRLELVEPPAGLHATLRPYQVRGLAWLAFLDELGLGACLADDMGLGKTVQLLALEVWKRQDGKRAPTLVVCPMSVVGNWQREASRFAPGLDVHVHHGADRLSGAELRATVAAHDLVITTYAIATRDALPLAEVEWDRVVLDEAQNIKNASTRQSRAVRGFPARHRVVLTGTPVENRLAELWSLMDFANPGILATLNAFRARFAVPIERYRDEDAAVRLRKITRPFVLRRLKTDPRVITDLPDKLEMKQLCTLTTEQATLYRAVVNDMLERIEDAQGLQRKGMVIAGMSKLKQVCNHPAQLLGDGSRVAGRSGKVDRLEEVLEEIIADGDKVLCFTQFTRFGDMIVPHLAARFDTEVLFLHGGTPKGARDRMVERFQSATGPSIFVLSLKAGGTGLNLTAANHVIHLDRWWNPAVEDQATDRAFRIGQRNHVQVRKFVCIGTLEEKIDLMIEEKRSLAQLVVGAGENWLTELSTGQLRELLTLSPEAVGG
ncbi:DEAD/DEAH box helicase [Umezawaea endophytica]|uniref:DEAD/DEAH box helicase n=1 Tax=Umezawaea endophytica TaxID=1654476 RepID=A0A9X3ADV6_9PSEU|nr:DEAD/DEAH box helicase [Umezawaea endophytica]MCS7476101.1 DEAD/DEAH box helicase [Umezawaea endophytica]